MARLLALMMAIPALCLCDPAAARTRAHHAAPAAKAKPPSKPAATPAGDPDEADDKPERPTVGAALPLRGLYAASEADARSKLGPPDLVRAEGQGAMWTYRLPDCALFVFFRAVDGQPLRVSGAAAGPRRRGLPALPVETCIAAAMARG